MIEIILYGITVGLTLAIPLGMGPAFFVLIETSITKGFRSALYFDLGVIIADILFIAIAYLGSKPMLSVMQNSPSLFLIGGLGLIVFGLVTIVKKEKTNYHKIQVKKSNYLLLVVKGFLLNFINVGVLLYWIGIVVFVVGTMNLGHFNSLICFTTILITYMCVDIVKILLAKKFKKILTPQKIDKIKKILGYILIICGLVIMAKAFASWDKIINI